MNLPNEVIGLKGFSIPLLLKITKDCKIYERITTEWEKLASKLQISEKFIRKMRLEILLGKEILQVLEDILIEWKMRCGSGATLLVLIEILDKECNWKELAEDLYQKAVNKMNRSSMKKLTCWQELCRAERGELLGTWVHFLGRKQKLFEIAAQTMEFKFIQILEKTLQGKHLEEFAYSFEYTLTIDTIPQATSHYIARYLIPYTLISPEALTEPSKNIFLVEGISWSTLSYLVSPAETDRSSNQLSHVNVQYIRLDNIDHFEEICQNTKSTVHLLNYQKEKFSWIKTRGDISGILEYLTEENNAISEKTFVDTHIRTRNSTAICICSGPGTGKTELINSLARYTRTKYLDRLVILLHFNDVIAMFQNKEKGEEKELTINSVRRAIANLVSCNKLGEHLLFEVLSCNGYHTELFLDGYDDALSDLKLLAQNIITAISSSCSNMRVIFTSRHETPLEFDMPIKFLRYKIQPFYSELEKVKYFLSHWSGKFGFEINDNLGQFAKTLLKKSKAGTLHLEEMIAGFPLQAALLADVFSETAKKISYREITRIDSECISGLSLHGIYCRFFEARFSDKKEDFRMKCLQHAIRAVYMAEYNNENALLLAPNQDDTLPVDIFESFPTRNVIRFKHKTFAEFQTAQLFVDVLMQKRFFNYRGLDICSILKFCLETSTQEGAQTQLANPALCYFLDAVMLENNLLQQEKCLDFIKSCVAQNAAHHFFTSSLAETMSACVLSQHYAIFCLLAYCFISPNPSDLTSFTVLDEEEWKTLVLCAAQNASIELVRKVWQMWESTADGTEEICKLEFRLKKYFDIYLTPVHVAAQRGSFRIFQFFFKIYSNNTNALKGLLHVSVGNSYNNSDMIINEKLEIVDFLLSRQGKEILEEVTAGELYQPLLSPEIHWMLIRKLIQSGANVTCTTANRNTVAHNVASYFTPGEYHDLVSYLIDNRKSQIFKYRNHLHETPLHTALKNLKIKKETVELLVSSGEVGMDSEFGHKDTILYHLVRHGYPVSTLVFVQKYSPGWASPTMAYKDESTTLLHVACEWGHGEAICYLLSLGVDTNALNKERKTPLHLACANRAPLTEGTRENVVMDIIMALISHGADVNALDDKGNAPLSYVINDSMLL